MSYFPANLPGKPSDPHDPSVPWEARSWWIAPTVAGIDRAGGTAVRFNGRIQGNSAASDREQNPKNKPAKIFSPDCLATDYRTDTDDPTHGGKQLTFSGSTIRVGRQQAA
jgi:hypothetical protein